MTVLDMTQNILSALEEDEVNSITDTVASTQVAEVLRETYYEILGNLKIPGQEGMFTLDGLSDTDRPNYLKVPSNVRNVDWISYDHETGGNTDYHKLTYLEPEDFFAMSNRRAAQDNITEVEDFSGVRLQILNNASPTYWTSFDDLYVVCDSFDSTLGSTLMESKTAAYGLFDPVFTLSDSFIPSLDVNHFPLLLAEAKSVCFINLKQTASSKEEQRSRRQRVRIQNNQWLLKKNSFKSSKNYGRCKP